MATRYMTPGQSQRISAYVPLPIDFYQQQMDKREAAYQQGMGTILQAEDAYGGKEVLPQDVAIKNQLIEKYLGDVHQMVKSEYNGDYGKALIPISERMVKMNRDPLWQAINLRNDIDKQYRQRAIALGDKYLENPDPSANAFTAPITYDAKGVPVIPDYTRTFMEKPNYASHLSGIISKMANTMKESDPQLMGGALAGMFRTVAQRGYSEDEIRKELDKHPEIIDQFIANTGNATAWDPMFAGDREKIKQYVANEMVNSIPEVIQKSFQGIPGYGSNGGGNNSIVGPAGFDLGALAASKVSKLMTRDVPVSKRGYDVSLQLMPPSVRSAYSSPDVRTKEEEPSRKWAEQEKQYAPWKQQYGEEYPVVLNNALTNMGRAYATPTPIPLDKISKLEEEIGNNLQKAEFRIIDPESGLSERMGFKDLVKNLATKDVKDKEKFAEELRSKVHAGGMFTNEFSPFFGSFQIGYGTKSIILNFKNNNSEISQMMNDIISNTDGDVISSRKTKWHTTFIPGIGNVDVRGTLDVSDGQFGPEMGIQNVEVKHGNTILGTYPLRQYLKDRAEKYEQNNQ